MLAILGLTNYAPFRDDAAHTPKGTESSGTITATAAHTGNLTPADFAQTYDLGPLQHRGITGQGRTLGIVTLAGLRPGHRGVLLGQRAAHHDQAEPDHQLQRGQRPRPAQRGGGLGRERPGRRAGRRLAPDANIVVYPAPDTEGGYVDAFFAAASQNLADTVSSSWAESETLLQASAATGGAEPAYAQAFDEAFLEMAAQDQSTFIAAGDAGAYDAAADLGTTNLSVGSPEDSPFVTSVGGTTLGGTIAAATTDGTVKATIPAQRTWGWDWLWPDYAAFGFPAEASFAAAAGAGGGGGFSSYEPLPLYQSMLDEQNSPGAGSYSAVPYLTPAGYGNIDNLYLPTQWNFKAKPAVVTGQGTGRGLPDLVTDADPFTGYLLYDPLASPALQGGWGGTSFGAAQLNGAAALIDQSAGHRVGLWNPAIYSFALGSDSPFTPLSTSGPGNDSLYTPARPARSSTPAPASVTRTWPSWPATSASGPRRGPVRSCRGMPDT